MARLAGRGNRRGGVRGSTLSPDPAVQPANATTCGEPTLLAESASFETAQSGAGKHHQFDPTRRDPYGCAASRAQQRL